MIELLKKMIIEWSHSPKIDEERLKEQVQFAGEIYNKFSSAKGGLLLVLNAPTGFGKTEVIFAPYLYQFIKGEWFDSRMYLVEPVHALLRQMKRRAGTYTKLVKGITVGCDHGEVIKPTFLYTANITLTTIDAMAYGFLAKRVITWGKEYKTGRYSMPAGLLMNSYLVLDEAHLIQDQAFLAPRIVSKIVCSIVNSGGTVLLSSATLPLAFLKLFSCEKVELTKPKVEKVAKINFKKETIDNTECEEGSIIFVNTIERARKIFEKCESKGKVLLLHSLMKKEDKDKVIEELDKGVEDKILIATQTAEVGIDYKFKKVITEISPIDSLIQRIGRVREKEIDVEIFNVKNPLPYDEDVMNRTSNIVSKLNTIKIGDMNEVQQLIDEVYDDLIINKLSSLGESFYISSAEYLNELHLYSYPPERDVYLRPSYYVTLYLLTNKEFEELQEEFEKMLKSKKYEEVSKEINEFLLHKSTKYSISLVNNYNEKRLEKLISNTKVYNANIFSKNFLKEVKPNMSGLPSEMIVIINENNYSNGLILPEVKEDE